MQCCAVTLASDPALRTQGADFDTCVENVDIGGPSMMRSAAKNHRDVVVVSSPAQYPELLAELSDCDGTTSLALRRRFAAEAFHVSAVCGGRTARGRSAWMDLCVSWSVAHPHARH